MRILLSISLMVLIISNATSKTLKNEKKIKHEQLILVLTKNWETNKGELVRYEKKGKKWTVIGNPVNIVLGKNGLAWGIGLHKINNKNKFIKREGDNKSPAGIFRILKVFAKNKEILIKAKMESVLITKSIEAIDDPNSKYYNQIVDNKLVKKDWISSEKMNNIDLYDIGIIIEHNSINKIKNRGSCIFIHKWRGPEKGTAGCIAMKKKDLEKIFYWLDEEKNPIIIQIPRNHYKILKNSFYIKLPEIKLLQN